MPSQGSSFIPKAGAGPVRRTKGVRRVYILNYVSNIVFFSVLFAVIGIYVYAAFVDRSLAQLQTDLETAQSRFGVEDIERIKMLDDRLKTATELLEGSTAPSRIFTDIEEIVASNIVFSGLAYKQLPNHKFELTLTGRAEDFNQIIKQKELLKGSDLLSDAEISAFDYSVAGEGDVSLVSNDATVTFVFSDVRDIDDIAYDVSAGEVEEIVSPPANSDQTGSATSTDDQVLSDDATASVVNEEDNTADTATTTVDNQ